MTFNPYSASPSSASDKNAPPVAKKPIAAWIIQMLAVLSIPVLLFYGLYSAIYSITNDLGPASANAYFALVLLLLLLPWAIGIVVTIHRRLPMARWLGGVVIGLNLLAGMLGLYSAVDQTGGFGAYGLERTFAGSMMVLLQAYWLFAFAFSRKARHFFGLQ